MRQREKTGVEIESVTAGSLAAKAGISAGDTLISINGNRISDLIDFFFHKDDCALEMEFRKAGRVLLEVPEGGETGISLKHFPVKRCGNRCTFCFVSQLPKGMRKSLYLKDEDYRMSFIYGNYITMANLTDNDKKRIATQRLSPLYISIHSTDDAIRKLLLGNPAAPDIMKDLRFFRDNKLRAHTQIVLCPGINDGKSLAKTISDLYSFYPYVMSIAVVPVGLTAFSKSRLKPVGKEEAADALTIIDRFQKRFRKKHGENIVYGADELYIKAGGVPLPPLSEYGDLPQIENGVGLVPLFMHEAKRIYMHEAKKPGHAAPSGKKYLTFTGTSFYPYLAKFIDKLKKQGHHITPVPVENRFFGPSVTVTGLLTGRDALKSLEDFAPSHDILLVPDTVVREGEDIFLDDVAVTDMEAALGIKSKLISATPQGLLEAVSGEHNE
ncbi:MAG: DUF512 domain-containing protein [Nitrospiraceae bacterium]|nr:DUF512 domain-containing protein [Nitrospiraceae bacterium]